VETPEQAMTRLVGALELLYAQEAVQSREGHHAAARATQQRSAPLIQRIAELGAAAVTGPTRIRLAALAEHRRQSQVRMAAELARLRQEMARTRAIQARLKRIAPAYGRRSDAQPRLALVG
jgi:hypothetical protein